jgi:penicillin-binding protein 1B
VSRKKSRRRKKRQRRFLPYVLLALCLLALILGGYTLYLDHVIRQRFEGARWKLPAHVYARPLQLYGGLSRNSASIRRALQRLGYRRKASLAGPGSYHVAPGRIDLASRPFHFPDGWQQSQKVEIRFQGGQIKAIKNLQSGKPVSLLRLDPLLIGSIYPAARGADRIPVKLGHVPALLPKGLIAVEDRHFRSNIGLDFGAIARAAFVDVKAHRIVQGGSTISQQLVKNLFLSNRQTLWRKFNGAIMALLLNLHYSKDEILQTYLNAVYLGQQGGRNIRGFGLASRFYFHAPLSELDPGQVALLVGMVKGPSYYNPVRHPKRARARRNVVLEEFRQQHLLSRAQAIRAENRPLALAGKSFTGTTQYPAFVDLVKRQLLRQYRPRDLTTEGLRIFTTLNPHVQSAAERSVTRGLARLEKQRRLPPGTLQAAAVVTAPQTGHVLAVIGGRGNVYRGFNRALDAHRQIGSLVKPAIYLTALEDASQYTLITPLSDTPVQVKLANGKTWRPHNYARKHHGEVPLYLALAHSYNLATVHLGMALGLDTIMQTLHQLGVENTPSSLPARLLGAFALTPVQVAQMYNTLASGGFYTPLQSIRAVTTQDGDLLKHYPLQVHRAVKQAPAYLTDWALRQAVRQGTGEGAYAVLPKDIALAGKTGTSSKLRDSWFAGFGRDRLAVVWVGRDDDKPAGLTGAAGALPIWSHLMRRINIQGLQPVKPSSIQMTRIDPKSGKLANGSGPETLVVPFIKGSQPKQRAPGHRGPVHKAWHWLKNVF